MGRAKRHQASRPTLTPSIDLALSRLVSIASTQNLELRVEVFNLLNTFNWGNLETNLNAGTFGRITSMAGSGPNAFGPPATPRIMQFGVKYGF